MTEQGKSDLLIRVWGLLGRRPSVGHLNSLTISESEVSPWNQTGRSEKTTQRFSISAGSYMARILTCGRKWGKGLTEEQQEWRQEVRKMKGLLKGGNQQLLWLGNNAYGISFQISNKRINHRVYLFIYFWTLLPPPSPFHPSGSSQCTSPNCFFLSWSFSDPRVGILY